MAHYYIDKRLGETPLEALHRLRKEEGIAEDVPLTYAGRLDPAAEGVLLVLSGEDCKQKDAFLSLSKTYEVEVLLGVETDTHDLLGIPSLSTKDVSISEYLKSHTGVFEQVYPAFSSKPVSGVPLHVHAREGNMVDMPTHSVELISYSEPVVSAITKEEVLERVGTIAALVQGDFRQEEIVHAWASCALPEILQVASFSVTVSGGFYVRMLAHELGGCLFSLRRSAIHTKRTPKGSL